MCCVSEDVCDAFVSAALLFHSCIVLTSFFVASLGFSDTRI